MKEIEIILLSVVEGFTANNVVRWLIMKRYMMTRSKLSLSDEWETPQWVFDQLCYAYSVRPLLDVAATEENTKCEYHFNKQQDGLEINWCEDIWCNPPHSKTRQFVEKAYEQWQKHNINIMMLIPLNSIGTKYSEKYIKDSAEWHPLYFRIKFLRDGVESEYPSRNGYAVVIWRARK